MQVATDLKNLYRKQHLWKYHQKQNRKENRGPEREPQPSKGKTGRNTYKKVQNQSTGNQHATVDKVLEHISLDPDMYVIVKGDVLRE
jgi:hypothetical protein